MSCLRAFALGLAISYVICSLITLSLRLVPEATPGLDLIAYLVIVAALVAPPA